MAGSNHPTGGDDGNDIVNARHSGHVLGTAILLSTFRQARHSDHSLINSGGGALYSYDSGNAYAETLNVAGLTGAFSISSGPAANTIYIQSGGGVVHVQRHEQCRPALAVQSLVMRWGRPRRISLRIRFGCESLSGRSYFHRHLDLGRRWFIVMRGYCRRSDRPQRHVHSRLDRWWSVVVKSTRRLGRRRLLDLSVSEVQRTFGGLDFRSTDFCMRQDQPQEAAGFLPLTRALVQRLWFHSLTYAPYDMATQPFEVDEPTTVPEPTTLYAYQFGGLGYPGLLLRKRKPA